MKNISIFKINVHKLYDFLFIENIDLCMFSFSTLKEMLEEREKIIQS